MAITKQLLANLKGPRGEQGIQGIQGPQGPKGDTGATEVKHAFATTKADLPTTGESGKVYFIPTTTVEDNNYDEYLWISENSAYEYIGQASVNLTDYYKKTETYSKSEIDTLMGDVSTALATILGA